jgi:hypothetical protein
MAYYLSADGVNDVAVLDSTMSRSENAWEIEFRVANKNLTSNIFAPIVGTGQFENYVRVRWIGSDTQLMSRISGVNYSLTSAIDTSDNLFHKYNIIANGTVLEFFIDDIKMGDFPFTGSVMAFDRVLATGSQYGFLNLDYIEYFDRSSGRVSVNKWNANSLSSNGIGSILYDDVGGNNGTLINFPTDNSQWVFYDDGGGSIDVTGQTANYNHSAIPGSVELTGEITVTGGTANYNYSGLNGGVELTGEIVVNGQTANYNYTGLNGSVLLQGQINVIGQTATYDYTGLNASVLLSGEIVVTGQTANYDYFGVGATINLFDIWQIKDPVSTNWTVKDKELTDWGIKDPVKTVWSKK